MRPFLMEADHDQRPKHPFPLGRASKITKSLRDSVVNARVNMWDSRRTDQNVGLWASAQRGLRGQS